MEIKELYLKTAFCCMACDGEIDPSEVALLKKLVSNGEIFSGLNVQEKLDEYVKDINNEGRLFLNRYIEELTQAGLDDESSLRLIKLAIDTIEADERIEYSEVSFFKRLRKRLTVSDKQILAKMPDKEDYLLPDIEDPDDYDWDMKFDKVEVAIS